MNYKFLRKKYPCFVYEKYSYRISKNNLEIFFDFILEPDPALKQTGKAKTVRFKPRISIEKISKSRIKKIGKEKLDDLIFNLGMIEMASYWKAASSSKITIKAGHLDKKQVDWWKDLMIKGMGQFFYENKINFTAPNFLKIETNSIKKKTTKNYLRLRNSYLVAIGGGKDSAVTLELLKKADKSFQCFSLNPTKSAREIISLSGDKKPIIVKRKIDENLLWLNRRGFLNGHTPFSAYLAFLSVLAAVLFNYKYIVFSNERSSNEGNVKYLDGMINHQWSKSFEFEKKFRDYAKKYLSPEIEYFSFLRPLYEIQIAKIFSKQTKYFPIFLSCNQTYKKDFKNKSLKRKWCGKCSKCLFVFMVLYPFLKEKNLVNIFKKNLFYERSLLPIMQELTGEKGFKPFECVGTKEEILVSLYFSSIKNKKRQRLSESQKIPFLLKHFEEKILPKYPKLKTKSKKILKSWNRQHNLPESLKKILQKEISKKN